MKKYTKTFSILLATTCLSAVYAMDPPDSVSSAAVTLRGSKGSGSLGLSDSVSSTAVTVGGDGGSGSVLATRGPMTVSMVGIDPAGYALVEKVRMADVREYWHQTTMRINRSSAKGKNLV